MFLDTQELFSNIPYSVNIKFRYVRPVKAMNLFFLLRSYSFTKTSSHWSHSSTTIKYIKNESDITVAYFELKLRCVYPTRLHYFRNDSVRGFLLAVSVFSYPHCPRSPPLYVKVVNLHVGETRLNFGSLFCVLSITHHDVRTWFILDFGYDDVGLHLHLSRFSPSCLS